MTDRAARTTLATAARAFDVAAARRALLAWYRRERRDLPWRRSRDPYRIWLSETMLQQTRVDVVVPYYERFLERFPDVDALARAELDDVLHAWAGLGYYRRARHLHAAAGAIAAAGRFPTDPIALAELPGIGRYTAGAISSIAFGVRAPILDGNVVRVFARLLDFDGDTESTPAQAVFWDLAARFAATPHPGDTNQSLMELGAMVCGKPRPRCDACPVARHCAAHATGRAASLPRPRRRAAPQRVRLVAAIVRHRDRLLLVRRRSGTLLRDWWELPVAHHRGAAGEVASSAIRDRLAVAVGPARTVGRFRHGILHNTLDVTIVQAEAARPSHRATATRRTATPANVTSLANLDLQSLDVRWVRTAERSELPLSTLTRKSLRLVEDASTS